MQVPAAVCDLSSAPITWTELITGTEGERAVSKRCQSISGQGKSHTLSHRNKSVLLKNVTVRPCHCPPEKAISKIDDILKNIDNNVVEADYTILHKSTLSKIFKLGTWDLASLGNSLNGALKGKFPGVNTPFTYIGSEGTIFCWHSEDMNLMALSFLFLGAPKIWFIVPAEEKEKFEKLMEELFPLDAACCEAFIQHKVFIVNPNCLTERGIRYHRIIQRPGELVMVSNAAYHFGFNLGDNVAEAVNFYMPFGFKHMENFKNFKNCSCKPSYTQINKHFDLNLIKSDFEKVVSQNRVYQGFLC